VIYKQRFSTLTAKTERVDLGNAKTLGLGNTEVDEDGGSDQETSPDKGDLGTNLLLNDRSDEGYRL
jgi:hypothetical protein